MGRYYFRLKKKAKADGASFAQGRNKSHAYVMRLVSGFMVAVREEIVPTIKSNVGFALVSLFNISLLVAYGILLFLVRLPLYRRHLSPCDGELS